MVEKMNLGKFVTLKLLPSLMLVVFLVGSGVRPAVAGLMPPELYTTILDAGWTTEQAVPNGSFRVLVTAADTNYNDGIPDLKAFDYGTEPLAVRCPNNIAGYTFGTPTAAAGSVYLDLYGREIPAADIGSYAPGTYVRYHSFVCPYTGKGAQGVEFDADNGNGAIWVGEAEGPQFVNPARDPSLDLDLDDINHSEQVDAYIQNLDADGKVVTFVKVAITALINDILVTASFPGEITFRVNGVPANTVTTCGTTDLGSSATLLDFGSPQLNVFTTLAQQIEVVSSAFEGYQIGVYQTDQMAREGAQCAGNNGYYPDDSLNRDCIADFGSLNASQAFTNAATQKGLAYRAGIAQRQTQYTTVPADMVPADTYRKIADHSAGEYAPSFVTSSSATDNDLIDVCYRMSIDAMNHSGVYGNTINYLITASF